MKIFVAKIMQKSRIDALIECVGGVEIQNVTCEKRGPTVQVKKKKEREREQGKG